MAGEAVERQEKHANVFVCVQCRHIHIQKNDNTHMHTHAHIHKRTRRQSNKPHWDCFVLAKHSLTWTTSYIVVDISSDPAMGKTDSPFLGIWITNRSLVRYGAPWSLPLSFLRSCVVWTYCKFWPCYYILCEFIWIAVLFSLEDSFLGDIHPL